MINLRVGKKQIRRESLKKSYRLYDACEICPLSIYIDAICNNNLKALVISGNPTEGILKLTKRKLSIEFSELSGNKEMAAFTNLIRQIYLHQIKISGLRICVNLILGNKYEEVSDYLKKNGIRLIIPNSLEQKEALINKITAKIKGNMVKLNELQKRYNTLNQNNKSSENLKSEYYTQLLVTLSKHTGFQLRKENLTLSELAFYLKDYNEYVSTLNIKNNGIK